MLGDRFNWYLLSCQKLVVAGSLQKHLLVLFTQTVRDGVVFVAGIAALANALQHARLGLVLRESLHQVGEILCQDRVHRLDHLLVERLKVLGEIKTATVVAEALNVREVSLQNQKKKKKKKKKNIVCLVCLAMIRSSSTAGRLYWRETVSNTLGSVLTISSCLAFLPNIEGIWPAM